MFDGDRSRFRGWIFDLTVCVGKVDKEIAGQMVKLTASGRSKDDRWDPRLDQEVDQELYEKYSGELYGILCELTTGEPKNLVRGIVEGGFRQDGFKALASLNKRYETKNGATLLHVFLEVVNPTPLKSGHLIAGISRWETRMAVLTSRYGEELTPCVKLAILVGLLPKEYQDMIMQNMVGKMGDQLDYE